MSLSISGPMGLGIGRGGISVAPFVPALSIFQRNGSAILDRSGNNIETRI